MRPFVFITFLIISAALGSSFIGLAMGPSKSNTPVPTGCAPFTEKDWKGIFALSAKDSRHESMWKKLEIKVRAARAACDSRMKADPKLQGCLDNLQNFVTNQRMSRESGHSMAFRRSNADYLARQPKEMISFPAELADGLPKDWKAICKKKGWDCVPFVSKSLPNPPALSHKRLLIRETGSLFDRWMLFTLPNKGTAERLVDFMGVEHTVKEPSGALIPLERPKLHFVEYWRDSTGKSPVYRKGMAACYRCHPSGMRDIVPAHGSVDAEGAATVLKLNKWMASRRPFEWGEGTVIPEFYGPPMGERQTCTQCHNGEYRGVLNAAHLGERSRHQFYFKMVQDLTMPPGKAADPDYKPLFDAFKKAALLSDKEREVLYSPTPLIPLVGVIGLGLGEDRGPMAVSNKKLLKFLNSRELISDTEYDQAVDILHRTEKEMNREYIQMKEDYRGTLTDWLKGERPECRPLFN